VVLIDGVVGGVATGATVGDVSATTLDSETPPDDPSPVYI